MSTFTFNAIGNLISKSDVGTYSYLAPGQPRPHGVTSISGGVITFTYDTKGNMTSGNGLTIAYTAFNKPATITRGTHLDQLRPRPRPRAPALRPDRGQRHHALHHRRERGGDRAAQLRRQTLR